MNIKKLLPFSLLLLPLLVFAFGNNRVFKHSQEIEIRPNAQLLIYSHAEIEDNNELRLHDSAGSEYVSLKTPAALGATYDLTLPVDDGTSNQVLGTDGAGILSWLDALVFTASNDNRLVRTDTVGASDIQESGITISDTDGVTGVTSLDVAGAFSVTTTTDSSHPCPTMTNTQRDLLSPAAGDCIYSSTDSQLQQYNGSAWEAIGSGTGGGAGALDIYYTEDFETTDASDFTCGQNATFLGAGSVDGTLADETVSPLAGTESLKYTMSTSSTNDYCASPVINIDDKQSGNTTGATLYFTYDGDDDDIKFVFYDVTGAAVISDDLDVFKVESNPARFAASVEIPSTSTQIRWGFHVVTGNNTQVLTVDDVEFSTNPLIIKDLINLTDWDTWTPTGTWTTNTTYTGFQRRVGDSLESRVKMVLAGAPTAATLRVDLPSGLTIDTSKIDADEQDTPMGDVLIFDSGGSRLVGHVYYADNNTRIVPMFITDSGTEEATSNIGATSPITFASGDEIHFNYKVPITGWTASTENIISASRSFGAVRGSTASAITLTSGTDTVITFGNNGSSDFDKDGLLSSGVYTAPRKGTVELTASLQFAATASQHNAFIRYRINGGSVVNLAHSSGKEMTASNDVLSIDGSIEIDVSKNDTIEVLGRQQTGGNLDISQADLTNINIKYVDREALISFPTDQSNIVLNTANGHGSTNTKFRRFTNTVLSQGEDITYADSATLGGSFTVNKSGMYAISYTDSFTNAAAGFIGLSKNSSQGTTNIDSITLADRLAVGGDNTAGFRTVNVAWTGYLQINDVIRAHTNAPTTWNNNVHFSIAKIGF